MLGPVPAELAGCDHPHMAANTPYEDFERYMIPFKLAERTAELKLYLAVTADEAGLHPTALSRKAEPVAAAIFGKLRMSDIHDWQSVIAAYTTLNAASLDSIGQ
jgi:hypothetical protein